MLKSVDESFKHSDNPLSAVASDDKLFLSRNTELTFDKFSLEEVVGQMALVHDAVDVLYRARCEYDDQWLISQGQEIGINIDEAFIANYEHLLLQLLAQLVDALTRKVIEALISGGQDKKQRKLLSWFAEYPNNCHPLSTTWPWSIKPSLAVLWGVCWMFFYRSPSRNPPSQRNASERDGSNNQNGNSNQQNVRIPHYQILQQIQYPRSQPTDCKFHLAPRFVSAVRQHTHAYGNGTDYNFGVQELQPLQLQVQQHPQQLHSGNNVTGHGENSTASGWEGPASTGTGHLSPVGHVVLAQHQHQHRRLSGYAQPQPNRNPGPNTPNQSRQAGAAFANGQPDRRPGMLLTVSSVLHPFPPISLVHQLRVVVSATHPKSIPHKGALM